jgi:hypothetical protein
LLVKFCDFPLQMTHDSAKFAHLTLQLLRAVVLCLWNMPADHFSLQTLCMLMVMASLFMQSSALQIFRSGAKMVESRIAVHLMLWMLTVSITTDFTLWMLTVSITTDFTLWMFAIAIATSFTLR